MKMSPRTTLFVTYLHKQENKKLKPVHRRPLPTVAVPMMVSLVLDKELAKVEME